MPSSSAPSAIACRVRRDFASSLDDAVVRRVSLFTALGFAIAAVLTTLD
jgi:hypothetical protein